MNGRIYDPTLGRFLQADPFIQAPSNSQSYNRYSYVLNNPMSYTDPSGYFFSGLAKKVGRKFIRSAVKIFGAKAVNIVGTFVATYFGNAYGAALWTYEFNRAMGVSSSGALRASAVAFVAASIPAANTGNAFSNFVVDGVVGGSISYTSGGNFGHGFWSAGLNSAVGGGNVSSNAFVNVVSSAVIGGTISKVTGGKFANGASSAAFSSAMRQDWGEGEAFNGDKQPKDTGPIKDTKLGLKMVDGKLTGTIVWSCKSDPSICAKLMQDFNSVSAENEFLDINNRLYNKGVDTRINASIGFASTGTTAGEWFNKTRTLILNTDLTYRTRIIQHEFGHSIGLNHILDNSSKNFMSYYETNPYATSIVPPSLTQRQISGLKSAYTTKQKSSWW